ncbi:hypothetical protein U1Q18_022678, partial [Sarracenia purpurea var. burkii]
QKSGLGLHPTPRLRWLDPCPLQIIIPLCQTLHFGPTRLDCAKSEVPCSPRVFVVNSHRGNPGVFSAARGSPTGFEKVEKLGILTVGALLPAYIMDASMAAQVRYILAEVVFFLVTVGM